MDGERLQSPLPHSNPESPEAAARAAYFDSNLKVWVLSQFADLQAALHEPNLWPVGPNGEGQLGSEDRALQARKRTETQAALPASKLAEWKSEFEALAEKVTAALPSARPIDVHGEFARPWSLALAMRVTGADPAHGEHLASLAAKVTSSTADPEGAALKLAATAAGTELDRALSNSTQPMAGPAFVALSQTLPCFLANAWFVLLNHPGEMERLRAHPDLLPRAVEELLRVAGLANVVHRQAVADVKVGALRIERGQRVNLMVALANHDPEHFAEPNRLDLSRRDSGHFAMGAGQHSCAAASLIRMATGVATRTLVHQFRPAEPADPISADPVQWHGGAGFRWPSPVYAMLRTK